ncbi:MAG: PAS domain S-box protein [Bacteroidota bacterium]|nr:PAS domain S-box protein [Bacteroidota bacterium]
MNIKLYKTILDNSQDCIVLIGKNHEVLAFNKTISDIFKVYFKIEIKVGDIYYPDFVVDELKDLYLDSFKKAMSGELVKICTLTKNANASLWFEYHLIPVYDDNELIGLTLRAKNITTEKDAQLKFEELSSNFKAILDNTDESIILLDRDYKILALNKVAEDAIKYHTDPKDYTVKDIRDYVPDSNNLFYLNYPKALKGERIQFESSYINSKNEMIWFKSKLNPVYDDEKNLVGVSIFAKDITEQKKIELKLEDSENSFKTIVENSPTGKFITKKGKIIYVNPAFIEIFGYQNNRLINKMTLEDLIHKDDINKLKFLYSDIVNSKKPDKFEVFRTKHQNGNIIYVELFLSSIVYHEEPAIIGTFFNVTERIEEEDRINRIIIETQEKERLQLGMDLHDNVKQILSGINMHIGIIQKILDKKEEVAKILIKLKKYNNQAIDELRRLSHHLAPLIEDDTDLNTKIDWLVFSMNLHDTLSIIINIEEQDTPLSNEIQLAFYRILQEQFNNIVKYAKASKVEINLKYIKNNISFEIKDDGVGFDVNSKRQGIGLENISRRVKILNGNVEIISAIGNGSQVKILVPRFNS